MKKLFIVILVVCFWVCCFYLVLHGFPFFGSQKDTGGFVYIYPKESDLEPPMGIILEDGITIIGVGWPEYGKDFIFVDR